jgi:hypothetical protein
LPIPDAVPYLFGQGESELTRQHADLTAMVSFVTEHVAEHFEANRHWPSPAIAQKFFDAAATIAERVV